MFGESLSYYPIGPWKLLKDKPFFGGGGRGGPPSLAPPPLPENAPNPGFREDKLFQPTNKGFCAIFGVYPV